MFILGAEENFVKSQIVNYSLVFLCFRYQENLEVHCLSGLVNWLCSLHQGVAGSVLARAPD